MITWGRACAFPHVSINRYSSVTLKYLKYLCFSIVITSLFLTMHIAGAAPLEKAKDFELRSIDGKTYRLSGLKEKVVLVNFWATWCKYCVKENPSLDRLYREFKDDDFIVLGISVDRSVLTVENFLKKNPVSYPVLMDSKGDVFVKTYTLRGIPITFLINKEGYIVEKFMGKQNFDSVKFMDKISVLLRNEGK